MYIRAKRKKTTLFLHVDPTDTILEVKQRIQELLQQVLSAICQSGPDVSAKGIVNFTLRLGMRLETEA